MAATRLAPLVAFAALLAAGEADAKVYVEWRPRISLMAGYNDNVLLNGSGADGFGQAVPGIKLDLFGEHNLHVAADCRVVPTVLDVVASLRGERDLYAGDARASLAA